MHARREAAPLIGALIAALAWAAGSAHAASYTVWSCRGPDGAPISTRAWERVGPAAAAVDTCIAGGSLMASLSQSDTATGNDRGFRFVLPPDASVNGYRLHLLALTTSVGEPPKAQAGVDHSAEPGVEAGCLVAACTFGVLDPPLTGENLVASAGIYRDRLSVLATCRAPFGCYDPGGGATLAEIRLFRAQVDVRDDDRPVLLEPTGLPAEGQPVSANGLVTLDVSDGGGGVATVALLVDGVEVAHQDAGGSCSQPYVQVAPCPAQLTALLPLAVSGLSPGAHTVGLRAIDAAGNVTTSAPVTFQVPAPAPPPVTIVERVVQVPLPAAQKPVTVLVARDRIALPAKGRSINGVVLDAAGQPVAGATVTVRSRPFGTRRAAPLLERTLTTDAAGRFSAPAGTTSRRVTLDVNDAAHRAVDPVEVSLLQRLTVGVLTRDSFLRNGSTLTLRAHVSGVGAGAGGKVVLVQAFVEGRWTTVDSIAAHADGRAQWRYRFRATTRRTAYRFRVKVERTGDVWPWPTTTSRVLRVEVRP